MKTLKTEQQKNFFFLNKCNKHNSQGHAHNLELIVWSDTLTQQYKDWATSHFHTREHFSHHVKGGHPITLAQDALVRYGLGGIWTRDPSMGGKCLNYWTNPMSA